MHNSNPDIKIEERSSLLTAESNAASGKKGLLSQKDPPAMLITALLAALAKITEDFLLFLQRNRRMSAVVVYVICGHRFKLLIPKDSCTIAFVFSGVRCPGRSEPYSEGAISLMR